MDIDLSHNYHERDYISSVYIESKVDEREKKKTDFSKLTLLTIAYSIQGTSSFD